MVDGETKPPDPGRASGDASDMMPRGRRYWSARIATAALLAGPVIALADLCTILARGEALTPAGGLYLLPIPPQWNLGIPHQPASHYADQNHSCIDPYLRRNTPPGQTD